MPTVFVPQQPSRFDAPSQMWVPSVNLAPAERFGKLKILLPPEANRLHTAPLVAALKERMAEFGPDDYVVAVGDPSLIAAASCIASRATGGLLRLLKWDRISSSYIAVELNV